jgi:hypothetical protein
MSVHERLAALEARVKQLEDDGKATAVSTDPELAERVTRLEQQIGKIATTLTKPTTDEALAKRVERLEDAAKKASLGGSARKAASARSGGGNEA